MEYNVGDYVTRNSYHNDMVFVIIEIVEDNYILKGLNIRLIADSLKEDLKRFNQEQDIEEEKISLERIENINQLERDDYFYLTGKIVHTDADISLSNNLLKPYKIMKKAKNEIHINHQKKDSALYIGGGHYLK